MPSTEPKVNEDLARERSQCTFNPLELTNFLDGGADKTVVRRATEALFLEDPELKDAVPVVYHSHVQRYEDAVRKSCILQRKMAAFRTTGDEASKYRQVIGGQLGSALLKDGNPLSLHFVMFLPALIGHASQAQQERWLPRAWSCQIIGTYAQTEMGHGTFIRGLETTATYDAKTQEFELHSPTLTSYKWWPGGLGHTANYAIVVAQLISNGKQHGIHPFIVQLRDEETHMPLPGVTIGEIGHKLGMNANDNGYLGFDRVRIPRDQMLMRNAQVLEDGTYVKRGGEKVAYGTMTFVRVLVVKFVSDFLAKAVTIAIRYSAVRRQSELTPGAREPQILDYRTQQVKLLPNLAACLAMRTSATWLWDMYTAVTSELDAGREERLPELHAAACVLKAVSASDGTAGVEACRLACGGHGYMTASNLPTIYGLVTAACTYEGENTVLLLQTARYLVKAWQRAKAGQTTAPTLAYLKTVVEGKRAPFVHNIDSVIEAFQQVAAGRVALAAEHLALRVRDGMRAEDAWNATSLELAQCSEAHGRAILTERFVAAVRQADVSESLKAPLMALAQLYAVHALLARTGDFLRFSSMQAFDVNGAQTWMESLLAELRPNAVGLVDAFDLRDEVLSSALGAYDGQVYQRLFDEAQLSPLNNEPVNASFHSHLKPFMKGNL